MRSHHSAVFIVLAANCTTLASPALSCPAFIEASQLGVSPARTRSDLRLFTLSTENGQRSWQSQPVQVDPMEAGMGGAGVLSVPEAGHDPDQEPLAGLDRIALRVETFGVVRLASDPPPCLTDRLFELQNPAKPERFAYLAACDDKAGATRSRAGAPVKLDVAARKIQSPRFDYTYLASNQLLFSKLSVRDSRTGALIETGADSDILLHLDVKNFFTMDLTNDNVQSSVEHTRTGPLGVVERLQFFLKLLVFEIDLKMATTASFFADSANLPMVMDIPLEPTSHLHRGSGMLFNWLPKAAKLLPHAKGSTAVVADAKKLASGFEALAKDGLAACRPAAGNCTYTMEGQLGTGAHAQPFFIDMVVPKYLVEAGFYPMYVDDLAKFKQEADFAASDLDQNRIAMYFEVSGLPKGQHKMDYWIRLGDGAGKAGACPAPVTLRGAIAAATPKVAH